MNMLLALIFSYIVGGIPCAFLFGKLTQDIDIREHGSGNVGATNVFRVIGKKEGIIVLILDAMKGILAVLLIPRLTGLAISESMPGMFCGLTAIAGHIWTPFLQFKGGKGVATTLGVFLAISPAAIGIAVLGWGISLYLTHYVSLSSIISAVILPLAMLILKEPHIITFFSLIISVFVIYKHKANIVRLHRGEEQKLF